MNGVQDVHRDMIQAVRLMGGTRVEIISKLLLPAALPWVLTGMRISVRYAFTNTLLAELLGANRGIGFLIEYNSGLFNATGVYAGIVVLVVFSVLLTELIQVLQRATAHHSEK